MPGYRGRGFPGTVNVAKAGGLSLAGTAVTATAAEINLLDADATEPNDGAWAATTRWAKATWDHGSTGNLTTGAGELSLGVTLPDNAIVVGGFIEVITNFAGNKAKFGLAGSAAGLLAATAVGSLTAGSVTPCQAILAAPAKQTAAKAITISADTATLTGGKANVWVEYFIGEA